MSNSSDHIGILGGTFDPIHIGHLIIAEEVRVMMDLDKIIFMPAGVPWFRNNNDVSSAERRVRMIELSIECNPNFELSSLEVAREGITYTADTLEILRSQVGPEAEISFIMGMDVLENFHLWKTPEKVVGLCNLIVVNRPGNQSVDVNSVVHRYPELGPTMRIIHVPRMEISSSVIRERVKNGDSIRYLVPGNVEKYILDNQLYKGSDIS
jgi:nicotinate-nucleotide adenylyltransferase